MAVGFGGGQCGAGVAGAARKGARIDIVSNSWRFRTLSLAERSKEQMRRLNNAAASAIAAAARIQL